MQPPVIAPAAEFPKPVTIAPVAPPKIAAGATELGKAVVPRKGISPLLLWGGIGALIVVAVVAVLLFLHSRAQLPAVSDADIEKSIQAKFAADPDISKCTIEVRSENGVATMTGLVNRPSDRSTASRIAHQQPGVRTVVDNLVLASQSSGSGGGKPVPRTLSLFDPVLDSSTKTVVINGVDTARPTTPFQFDWGDGTVTSGFFPQTKTYVEGGRAYRISVMATYQDGSHGYASTTVTVPASSNATGGALLLGFANGNVVQDRDAELRRNCGDFKRVYVPDNLGNKFTDLCGFVGKSCVNVCDWQGSRLVCDDVSQGGNRDGTRVAFCR
jgi:hypothetical protein